jgi:pimeloyl-ACP methyl ester carboxylesterase
VAKQVVILPGILGSDLVFRPPGGGALRVWYAPNYLGTNGPTALQLAPNGFDPGPQALGPLAPSGPISNGTYTPLVVNLEQAGWTVKVIAYDWRFRLSQLGPTVAAAIAAAFPTGDVHVVAHSMGGLVARMAYPQFETPATRSRWKRTVYLGTPHGGSHSATASLAGFSPGWGAMTLYAQAFGWLRFVYPGAAPGAINVIAASRAVLATWPGLACLMPSYFGPWAGLDPQAPNVYFTAPYFVGNPAVRQLTLDHAAEDVAALAALLTQPHPEQLNFLGIGTSTPAKFRTPLAIDDDAGYDFTTAGDGAVTLERGSLPGVNTIQISGGHQDYMLDGAVLRAITQYVDGPFLDVPDKIALPTQPTPILKEPVGTIDGPPLPWPDTLRRGDP